MPLPELPPWGLALLLEQVLLPWGLVLLLQQVQVLLPWPEPGPGLLPELLQVLLPELRVLLPGPPERASVLRTAEQTQCR